MENSTTSWETLSRDELFEKLGSRDQGLTNREVIDRIETYGQNTIPTEKPTSWLVLFFNQFKNPLIYILIIIAGITFWLGHSTDGFIISFVLLFNAVIGVVQEGRAQKALFALRDLTRINAVVKRDGEEHIIISDDLVPGDIVYLREGDKVPADIRIYYSEDLSADEAVLTGESLPVNKTGNLLAAPQDLMVDRVNMVFKGTYLSHGTARGIVVATGLHTEIGKISQHIAAGDTEMPLQRSLQQFTNVVIVAVFVLAVLFFGLGWIQGLPIDDLFITIASLVVAVIPEGMPVVLTLILAQGVKRMSRKNVLVKRLQAVEALGQAKVIAVDKTGTLTRNELVTQHLLTPARQYKVTGVGYSPEGAIMSGNEKVFVGNKNFEDVVEFARLSALSANSQIIQSDNNFTLIGDPTEAAMLVVGQKLGFSKKDLVSKYPLLDEVAFSYKTKYYANLHQNYENNHNILVVTGAPEVVLDMCRNLDQSDREAYTQTIQHWSEQGLRSIALAKRLVTTNSLDDFEIDNLEFVGLFAMKDALRLEVADAMKKAKKAGMRVVMITGDHKVTATAIAKEAGVYHPGDKVLTGKDIEDLSDETLARALDNVTVFARVTPEHKLRIIKAFRARGEIVAMTGDGVNDAPSLAAADLGVAMGTIGTEITKESADLILLDDNFGNIPEAVKEGRNIYTAIRKVIVYLLSTNTAEMLVVAIALVLALPIPLLPAQIIWLNLVTDSFLVIPLALEPREKGLLDQAFRSGRKIIQASMVKRILLLSTVIVGSALIVFQYYLQNSDQSTAISMTLVTIVFAQIFTVWSIRSTSKSIFKDNIWSNKWLIIASLGVVVLQVLAQSLPFMQTILQTQPLTIQQWLIALASASLVLWIDETRKLVLR